MLSSLNFLKSFFNFFKFWNNSKISPKPSFRCKIKDRDTNILIKVGDVFEELHDTALVIPINTTFDTNVLGIREGKNSIQNQVVKKFYEGNPNLLDQAITEELNKKNYSYTVVEDKPQKKRLYPIGTVVELRPQNNHLYFVTTSHINENERAEGTKEEQKQALIELWDYIKDKSTKTSVVIPLIGTNYVRDNITRQESAKMIIDSFISACNYKTFCNNLLIVIYHKDAEYVEWEELCSFLDQSCKNPKTLPHRQKKLTKTVNTSSNYSLSSQLSKRLLIIEGKIITGSGILLNNQGLAISCYHNFYNQTTNERNIIKSLSIKTEGFWVEIPYSNNVDFCFEETKYDDLEFDDIFLFRLKIDKNLNGIKDLPKLSVSRNVKQGDEVTVVAWDNIYDKNFVEHSGKVISVELRTEDHPNRFHIKLDGYLGYSGGGVFKNGELVGIINYIQTQRDNNIIASFIPNYITKVIEEEINDNA